MGHRGALADGGVAQQATGTDPGSRLDHGAALQLCAGPYLRVRPEDHVRVDRGRLRIHDRHTGSHPAVQQAAVQDPPRLRELGAVVHPEHLVGVLLQNGGYVVALGAQDGDNVGEIFLTFGVIGGDTFHRVGQQARLEGVDAGVDLLDDPLIGAGVGLLHDLHQRPVGVADDPAITCRVVHHGGQRGCGGMPGRVLTDQGGQRLAAQHGGVTVGHHHRALAQVDLLDHGADRVPSAAPAVLDDDPGVGGVLGEVADDLIAPVTHHDDEFCRVQFAGCGQHVIQHAPAADRMQDFREGGLHPRPRTRGQDDHGGRTAHAHVAVLLVAAPRLTGLPLPVSPAARHTA